MILDENSFSFVLCHPICEGPTFGIIEG